MRRRYYDLLPIVIILIVCTTACKQEADDATKVDGASFIEYKKGNMPLILTVPHGGSEKPEWIKDRFCADAVNVQDEFTLELAQEIVDAFAANGTYRPFVIVNKLHRGKVDLNRNRSDGTCGDLNAQKAYDAFHGFIREAKTQIDQKFSKGILVDIHGHGHEIQRIELGYLLYEEELRENDDALNQAPFLSYSSIQRLAQNNLKEFTHAELLRGPAAFGTLLQNRGFACVPSLNIPYPQIDEPYFSGGYITATHGSYAGGTIDAIQMECNREQVRDTAASRKAFAKAFVASILEFLQTNYFEEIPKDN
jgi:N-formylglutamate amidohydrolase